MAREGSSKAAHWSVPQRNVANLIEQLQNEIKKKNPFQQQQKQKQQVSLELRHRQQRRRRPRWRRAALERRKITVSKAKRQRPKQ